jgi:hypothetical protein
LLRDRSGRRDCPDYIIVLNADHFRCILTEYFNYYHIQRTRLSLEKDKPPGCPVQEKPKNGKVIALPRLGGLHHRYEWREAA